jgi:uncharacterized repeat protein (TIGR03809 family)
MPDRGSAARPRIFKVSVGDRCRVERGRLDKIKVFHKISQSRPIDSYRLRPRPFFSLRVTGWFMANQIDVARGRDIVARWCTLAERRLEYLTELFETGRWRRFHSESDFLENLREAKAAVQAWRDLLSREASRNSTVIDVSWLGRARPAPPRGGGWRGLVRLRQPALEEIPVELPPRNPIANPIATPTVSPIVPVSETAGAEAALSAQAIGGSAAKLASATPAIGERYPLLRNAL